MTTTITNRHQRRLSASADVIGPLLERLGAPDDPWWPTATWPPMVLDRPLAVGAEGRHGPINYKVGEHLRGRRLHLVFRPSLGLAPEGHHTFELLPVSVNASLLRHDLELVAPTPALAALWHLVIAPLHDALVEDLLDRAETAAGKQAALSPRPAACEVAGWTTRVRVTRALVLPPMLAFAAATRRFGPARTTAREREA